ncbi:MAG: alkaline phosphatase family protein [Vicinamibacteria bacterium]|nr:alkaline phosphatase family protein [Vicinamibacteria bacterium]
MSRRRASLLLVAVLATAFAPLPAAAWGFTGHRFVNRHAVRTLPPPLRELFAGNAAFLLEHSVDPDLWRGAGDDAEEPNHFLDMDAWGGQPPFADIPRDEAAHLQQRGAQARDKGRVPWRVAEEYRALVAAFRAGDHRQVLRHAAALSHYVADAHVPFHAVLNYDGQLSGQRGLHSRWESQLVERFEVQLEAGVAPAPAHRVDDPVAFTFSVLLDSFAAAQQAFGSDLAVRGAADFVETSEDDRYDDSFYSRFYAREGERLRDRLQAAATGVGSLWLSAWEEAGRPALDAAYREAYVRGTTRGAILSLDGAAQWMLDDAIARGVMPELARLRTEGASARSMLAALPTKTAAAHATLWTGAWTDRTGIAGNVMPLAGGSLLEWNTGYSSMHLKAEPLWVTAARQGQRATVVSAPQVYPWAPYLNERRFGGNYGRNLALFDGYGAIESRGTVHTAAGLEPRPLGPWLGALPEAAGELREVSFEIAGLRVDGLLFDDPKDPATGFDTLYLSQDRDAAGGIRLKPAPIKAGDTSAFAALALRIGGDTAVVHFRLWDLAPDASALTLWSSSVHVIRASRPGADAAALEATGGFVGNGASLLYGRGALGQRLWEGGDGSAERRYLETVELVARQFERLDTFAIARTDWDLLVTYLPYPDEFFHLWLGVVDPAAPGHDPRAAAALRPFVDDGLRIVDRHVANLRKALGPETVLAVSTDHGMSGVSRVVRPNVALAAAGLLAVDARGQLDLAATRAHAFAGGQGFVMLNRAARPGGTVAVADEANVRSEVVRVLKALKDPMDGKPVFEAVLEPRAFGDPSFGGADAGDLYLVPRVGYEVHSGLTGEVVGASSRVGTHGTAPERAKNKGMLLFHGPGVKPGADLGEVRQIDVAPTLCALLGLEPPKQATGQLLAGALARPLATPARAAR